MIRGTRFGKWVGVGSQWGEEEIDGCSGLRDGALLLARTCLICTIKQNIYLHKNHVFKKRD